MAAMTTCEVAGQEHTDDDTKQYPNAAAILGFQPILELLLESDKQVSTLGQRSHMYVNCRRHLLLQACV